MDALKKKYRKVGLLGTAFTMQSSFFKQPFEKAGIDIAVPSDEEILLINNRISSELERGIIERSTEHEILNVIAGMKSEHSIEAIILGCTELPLIINSVNSPVPILDTMDIHINAIVENILS